MSGRIRRGARLAALLLPAALLLATPVAGETVPPRPEGVTPEMEAAAKRGLDFLLRTQGPDGSWRNADRNGIYPAAMTGLAQLALMASGSTPSEGPYAPALRRSIEFLLRCQTPEGLFTGAGENRSMYGHGFAMLALAEAYGSEESLDLRRLIHRALAKAVSLTARSQSGDGGWNYTPDSGGDEGSVTITQLQALRACRNAGIKVPKKVIDGAVDYIKRSQQSDGGIAYRVNQRGSRPSISAAGLCCLHNAGLYEGDVVEKLLSYVQRSVSANLQGGHAYYTQLYMAQAMWLAGEETWRDYGPKISEMLVSRQASDGSWSESGVGSTYATAIGCIILQIPCRNLPILTR